MLDFLFPDLRLRNTSDKEKLELPEADPALVRRTIDQFALINRLLSGSSRLMREHFFRLMERQPERPYTLLDIGAGAGDIAIGAAREARRRGLQLEVTALDNDRRTLPLARQAVRDYPEIRVVEGDARDLARLGPFDFIFSNHLLHHLTVEEIGILLERVIAQTKLAFVMNDVKRSSWAYLGFTIFSSLVTIRSFHFHDGRLSIRRAFLPEELRDLIDKSFLDQGIEVLETYPARIVLVQTAAKTQIAPNPLTPPPS